MGHDKINKNESEYVFANIMDDVENVDTKKYLIEFHAKSIYPVIKELVNRDWKLDELSKDPQAIANASRKIAEEQINSSASLKLPEAIIRLFNEALSKKEQISLLKGVNISIEQLTTILIYAGKLGYKLSNYRFSGTPQKYVGADLPSFIYLNDNGEIEHYGETLLTDGQMKELIITSKLVLARILNNGMHWHCFYQTKSGVSGNEPGMYGRIPHIHYISDSFSISLEDIIKGFKGGLCPHSKVHLLLTSDKL